MKKVTIHTLINWKKEGKVFPSITAYDASFAQIFEQQKMPVLLVGDSLGNVLQGKADTLDVSMDEIVYHTRCVRAGNSKSLLLADMPFMSYETVESACINAGRLMKAGANMVKLEGEAWLADTVKRLTQLGIPVCAHLGLMPQSVNIFGGFKVQGREEDRANQIIRDALALQNAGAQLLVVECVPQVLAERLTRALHIPVIGIGAGNVTDGQILVMHDVLGISTGYIPSFSKNFLEDSGSIQQAVATYMQAVENRQFPSSEHTIA